MKTVAIDFDGVIHSYMTKWEGASIIPDPPVEGAFNMVLEYMENFRVVIMSSRARHDGTIEAMRNWFLKHGFPADKLEKLEITGTKIPATL